MKTILVPKFDEKTNFIGYKKVTVKNKIDQTEAMKVISELPGVPCGYCPAIYKITETKEPIEIRRFYDSRQNTKKLKGFFITVED